MQRPLAILLCAVSLFALLTGCAKEPEIPDRKAQLETESITPGQTAAPDSAPAITAAFGASTESQGENESDYRDVSVSVRIYFYYDCSEYETAEKAFYDKWGEKYDGEDVAEYEAASDELREYRHTFYDSRNKECLEKLGLDLPIKEAEYTDDSWMDVAYNNDAYAEMCDMDSYITLIFVSVAAYEANVEMVNTLDSFDFVSGVVIELPGGDGTIALG